jgi:hypothetical protein
MVRYGELGQHHTLHDWATWDGRVPASSQGDTGSNPVSSPLTGKKRYATRTVRDGKREEQRTLAEMATEAERGLTARTKTHSGRRVSLDAAAAEAVADHQQRMMDAPLCVELRRLPMLSV